MKYYEALYIVNPNFEQDRLDEVTKEVEEKILSYGFKVINNRPWGKKRLAYNIDKHKYGTYVLLQFELEDPEKLINFNRFMELHKAILRNQVVRLDLRPEVYTEAEKESGEKEKKSEEASPEKTSPSDKDEEISSDKKTSPPPEQAAVDEAPPEVVQEPEAAEEKPEETDQAEENDAEKDKAEDEESAKETEDQSEKIQE
ncbi:MAG: 30S ribosomal protein S6 [Candidatus Neomarinimicrobiota bacterium]